LHWHYEDEVRCFTKLKEKDTETNLYFVEFSEGLKLTQVIVGSDSRILLNDVKRALTGYGSSVEVFKARPAFRSFKVVRNRDASLWE
jgi:hypothetical protein